MKVALLLLLSATLHAALPIQLFPVEGPWKGHAGDDPRWAAPDFDDSSWSAAMPPMKGTGFSWYRSTLRIPQELSTPVFLWFPAPNGSFEVYANGRLILQYGIPGRWYTRRDGAIVPVQIPDAAPGAAIPIAVRFITSAAVGSAWPSPLLGSKEAVEYAFAKEQKVDRRQVSWLFQALLCLLFAAGSFGLWWRERDQSIYFWFAVAMTNIGLWDLGHFAMFCLGASFIWQFPGEILVYAEQAAWLFLFRGDSHFPGWKGIGFLCATIAWNIFMAIGRESGLTEAPVYLAEALYMSVIIFLVARIVWRDFHVTRWSGKALLFSSWLLYELSWVIWDIEGALVAFGARGRAEGNAGTGLMLLNDPLYLDLAMVGTLLNCIVIGGILLNRFTRVAKERQAMASELEAARVVQRLLLPEAVPHGKFQTNAVYAPARQVGGDFYQIVERPSGSLLVLAGDVSGKGLEAAMVASVAVGAFRHAQSDSPAELLEGLNRALTGHGRSGFVTCCCARFDADGRVTFANAGNPAPYIGGVEAVLESGLPLGVAAECSYIETSAMVGCGEQVTFVSDGVVEAASANGELFGFDRTREISGQTAAEIADAAKAWGQNDDITVVTVRRKA